jgi:hypothetical protein
MVAAVARPMTMPIIMDFITLANVRGLVGHPLEQSCASRLKESDRNLTHTPLANLHLIQRLQVYQWRVDVRWPNSVRSKFVADELIADAPLAVSASGSPQ